MTIEQLKQKMPYIDVTEWVQHENGGGWKHETARVPQSVVVPESTIIGSRCELGSRCTLGYGCTLGDGCKLGDGCTLGYGCTLGDGCTSTLYLQPSGWHPITASNSTRNVQIGCKRHSIEWWESHFGEVGKEESYTESQISEYGALLTAVRVWLDAMTPKEASDGK